MFYFSNGSEFFFGVGNRVVLSLYISFAGITKS